MPRIGFRLPGLSASGGGSSSSSGSNASLPLQSFFNYFDLKLGSEILTFFLLFNKVAGVYGLLAVFFGGSVAQVSLYVYSVVSIGVALWGLRVIGQENPPKVLLYSHLYTIDHLISTFYTLYFAVVWYKYTPHDGRRVANSAAQKEILEAANQAAAVAASAAADGVVDAIDGSEDAASRAMGVWKNERAFAAAVLLLGWLLKMYFILILYSFSTHLRRGTWRTLLANQLAAKQQAGVFNGSATRRGSAGNGYAYSHLRNSSTAGGGSMSLGAGELVWDENDLDEEDFEENSSRTGAPYGGGASLSSGNNHQREYGMNGSSEGTSRGAAAYLGNDEIDKQIRELESSSPSSSTPAPVASPAAASS